MYTKVCVRVEVVVPWGHLLWVEELCHLAPSRTARQAGSMWGVWGERRPGGVLDGRHRLGQWGGLRRLRLNYADRLWLWLLVLEREKQRRKHFFKTSKGRHKLRMWEEVSINNILVFYTKGVMDCDFTATPLNVSSHASQLICQSAAP